MPRTRYSRTVTRIIAGVAGSLRLEVPKAGTRPTSDKVREAVFSTLDSWGFTDGTRVIDLYAGSGALGLEAASRGAVAVRLVEKNAQAAQVATRNAKVVQQAFGKAATVPSVDVVRQSVQTHLDTAVVGAKWDVAFIDPPYDLGEQELSANLASLLPHLASDAAIMVERSSRSPEPTWPDGMARIRLKEYGETVLWWAEPTADEDTESAS